MATAKTWADNYRDPRWQKKRLEIMERDNFKCRSCDTETETLNVHHAYYDKGKMPWEYDNDVLITWREDCHKHRHIIQKLLLKATGMLTIIEFMGLFHLLCSGGEEESLLRAITICAKDSCEGFVDYKGLATIVSVLSDAHDVGRGTGK